jgi:hypothetical protein
MPIYLDNYLRRLRFRDNVGGSKSRFVAMDLRLAFDHEMHYFNGHPFPFYYSININELLVNAFLYCSSMTDHLEHHQLIQQGIVYGLTTTESE